MTRFVALLRGINVGDGNKLPMADLSAICSGLGWKNVRTYIASGNVSFECGGVSEDLGAALRKALPIDVPVLILEAADLEARLASCPFSPEAGNLLHGFFCNDVPTLDADVIAQYQTNEEIAVIGQTLWLHTPDGFSKSKLSERTDKVLKGTTHTARNLNTIRKLVDMARE